MKIRIFNTRDNKLDIDEKIKIFLNKNDKYYLKNFLFIKHYVIVLFKKI